MKRCIVISNFHEENSISRSQLAYKYFKKRKYVTKVFYSSFSHSLKKFRKFNNKDFNAIETIAYSSSLSLRRIFSYTIYAFKLFHLLRKEDPEIIYVNLPPNILIISVFLAKKDSCKVVFDIIDLWPEALPDNGNKFLIFFKKILSMLFKPLRDFGIKKSDYIISTTQFFYDFLNLSNKENSSVIHLKKIESHSKLKKIDESISIVYLGNIGNIYDFNSLIEILRNLSDSRPTKLHIIGEGPNKKSLLKKLDFLSLDYVYHGATFNEELKSSIISSCWFGYNGFKRDMAVGVSYKSIDYLSYGVPILNSLSNKSDTFKIVNSDHSGINFDNNKLENLIDKILSLSVEDITKMKKNAYETFKNHFSEESYYYEMDKVLKRISQHE